MVVAADFLVKRPDQLLGVVLVSVVPQLKAGQGVFHEYDRFGNVVEPRAHEGERAALSECEEGENDREQLTRM